MIQNRDIENRFRVIIAKTEYNPKLIQQHIQKLPVVYWCLHYDSCDVKIDWFSKFARSIFMLRNIRHVTIIENKEFTSLFTDIYINKQHSLNAPDVILAWW